MRSLLPLAVGCCAACTSVADAPFFQTQPTPPLAITVATDPPSTSDGAPRDAEIRLLFDDFPDPDTAVFGPVLLRSGAGNFDADVRVDFVGRGLITDSLQPALVIHPRALLDANTEYEVALAPQVRALDGRTVGGTGFIARIAVGSATSVPAPTPRGRTWMGDVGPILQQCSPYCHSPQANTGNPRAPERRLDFTAAPDDPLYGLINVPSVGLAGTPYELARVTPGDSARSVLLRKLLGGDHRLNSTDLPYPEMRVDGRRMPISICDDNPDEPDCQTNIVCTNDTPCPGTACDVAAGLCTQKKLPLDPLQIATIRDWIDQGAAIR